mgnify:CR=1 FL=1
MIDVWAVAANAPWILGLSLVLAALSWARWLAQKEHTRTRATLDRPPVRRAVDLGLLLFCAGLAATSRRTWERVLWAALAVAWLVQAALAGRNGARQRND